VCKRCLCAHSASGQPIIHANIHPSTQGFNPNYSGQIPEDGKVEGLVQSSMASQKQSWVLSLLWWLTVGRQSSQ
jgi:hypothetical protein